MELEKILDEESKVCPECAETIKLKAKKCRYCHTLFDPEEVDRQVEARRAELLAKKKRELRDKRSKEILAKKHEELRAKERENILAKEREGKTQCPQCENWDVYQTMTNDFGYSDWCPHCKKSLKSMSIVDEEKPAPPKKPSVLVNVLYIFAWIAVVGGGISYIIIPNQPPANGFYFALWIGILTAMTATRQGKSGWLWFFFGFIVIGFTTVFLIGFLQAFLGSHNKPINTKLREMKPIYENVSVQKLQEIENRLDQIEDVSNIKNINKSIDIIKLSQNEISKVEKAFNEIKVFVNENKDEIKNEGLDILIEVMEMNEKVGTFNHLTAYKDYLNAYKKYLLFSRDNFDAIMNGKEPETKEYDVLYAHYESAWSKMNDADLQKQMAIKEYLKEHPKFISHMQQAQKRLEKNRNVSKDKRKTKPINPDKLLTIEEQKKILKGFPDQPDGDIFDKIAREEKEKDRNVSEGIPSKEDPLGILTEKEKGRYVIEDEKTESKP
jgi:hypothetical protein